MTADSGGAPCVEDGVLTLAICKPAIRSSAVEDDWLFGVGGVRLGNRLIYIARVTKKLPDGDYYRQHSRRRDCIYSWNREGTTLKIRQRARYHTDGKQTERDVGDPPAYSKANVLLSVGEFRYLGKSGTPIDQSRYPDLSGVLSSLRRGHRVNHDPSVARELVRLKDEIWAAYPPCFAGEPSQPVPDRDGVCSCGERRSADD